MQDKWYSDKRDVLKWGVLLTIGRQISASRILQIAYYRSSEFPKIEIDNSKYSIPVEVIRHFRNVSSIVKLNSDIQIDVLDKVFENREEYLEDGITLINKYPRDRCVVFLDPDTGLESNKLGHEHVSNSEVAKIWNAISKDNILAIYQHQTNRNGREWIESKRVQLAQALCVDKEYIKVAKSKELVNDAVIYFVVK